MLANSAYASFTFVRLHPAPTAAAPGGLFHANVALAGPEQYASGERHSLEAVIAVPPPAPVDVMLVAVAPESSRIVFPSYHTGKWAWDKSGKCLPVLRLNGHAGFCATLVNARANCAANAG